MARPVQLLPMITAATSVVLSDSKEPRQTTSRATVNSLPRTIFALLCLMQWNRGAEKVEALLLSWSMQRIRPLRLFRDLSGGLHEPRRSSPSHSQLWNRYDDDDDDFDSGLFRPTSAGSSQSQSRKNDSPNSLPPIADTSSTVKSHFFSQKSLSDASFRFEGATADTFAQLCRQAGIQRPSKIQSMAWPVLVQESSHQFANAVILADQTGSGKTLAYLIPLLQRVVGSKVKPLTAPSGKNTTSAFVPATPRLLILAPTAELADQIQTVCQKLSKVSSNGSSSSSSGSSSGASASMKSLFSTVVLTASGQHATNIRDQIRLLQQKKSVDVLISTPGRIATILRTKHAAERVLDLRQLQMVVLDEVDVLLLDETFGPQLQTIGEATNSPQAELTTVGVDTNTPSTQFIFVTATLPDTVVAQVEAQFPGRTVLIKGPGLHRVAPTVSERLIDVSVPSALNRDENACFDAKARALQQALRQNRCKRTLVFCNTVATCRQVENLLYRQDRQGRINTVRAYHNAMTAESRNENLDFFAKAAGSVATDDATSYILVCTDRAARGVDFAAAAVDHVVIFDFPVDPAEYVRRVGRTARAGRNGASTVLAYGWQLPIARSVMGQQQLKDTTGKMNAAREVADGRDDEEYLGGVKGRRASTKPSKGKTVNVKDSIIGGNIASGKLWNDVKSKV